MASRRNAQNSYRGQS